MAIRTIFLLLILLGCNMVYGRTPMQHKMLQENNRVRVAADQTEQMASSNLDTLSQEWAEWMAANESMTHSNHPYPEIIFAGPDSVKAAFNGWQASGTHYGIILSGNTHAGFGMAIGNSGTKYWIGMYGNK